MNKLHVYTGDGKGKTSAAMGLALRSLGHGSAVLVAQFMKTGNSGELAALRMLPGTTVITAPPIQGFTFAMDEAQLRETARQQTAFVQDVLDAIAHDQPRTVVLDELGEAAADGLVPQAAAQALVDAALLSGETAVTGYHMPEWLLLRGDYVTRMQAVKHPYETERLPAREGVEW